MTGGDPILAALEHAGLGAGIRSRRPLSGGCIHRVTEVTLDDGRAFVAKTGAAADLEVFREEVAGLEALAATDTVLTPRPLAVAVTGDAAALLMTAVPVGPASEASWRRLGEDLAALHRAPIETDRYGETRGSYGFAIDNHLGRTHQPNGWMTDWVEFNAVRRLGHQVRLARDAHKIDAHEAARLDCVIDRLGRLIPRRPRPALLHGDLWSGNALPAAGGRIALIDPAPSIGDGWADIAMMRLFGGFAPACFEAYAAANTDQDQLDSRCAVYQLYHVLNHLNLFGRGYAGQAMGLVERLGA